MLNTVTILAVRKTSSLPKPLKTLLLSLAVADLGVGLVVQPSYIASLVMEMEQNIENNETYNKMVSTFVKMGNFFFYASFFSVAALSTDRFLAIHLHLKYQELVTHNRIVAVVISIWMLSAFFPLTTLWIPINITYVIFLTVEFFGYLITGYFYYKINLTVRRHANQIQALQVQEVTANGETLSNFARLRKSAVGTFYIYLVFVACYLPNICVLLAIISNGKSSSLSYAILYTRTLVLLNSSLNPLIYCWKMRPIQHAIMNILRNIFPSQN